MVHAQKQNSAQTAGLFELRFFCSPHVFVAGEPLKIVSARGVLEMLARVARADAPAHERDAVAFDVWPELLPSDARAALRRHLHYLDRALAAIDAPPLIRRDGTRLEIDATARERIDTRIFESLTAQAAAFDDAHAAYTGDFLESYDNPWVISERKRLRDKQRACLHGACEHALEARDSVKARYWSDELRRLDPLAEDGLRFQMRARAQGGDVPGALAECDAFETVLRAQLELRLSDATLALRQSLAERQAPQPKRFGFPAERTRFFGREHDLANIAAALRSESLVTVAGPPGIGKTRLAIRAAMRASDADDLPAYFVDVTALRDTETIAAAVLETLARDPAASSAGRADLEAAVRGKRLIIVLDNCEQAVDAVRSVVARILRCADRVRVLATSRVVLDAPGERLWTLEPLELGQAVNLFVDRTQLVRPHFKNNARTHERIVALCRHVDGLPLAIELAAARLRSSSIHGFTPSTATLSLRATFDWSIQLLDTQDRQLFRRLACFAGGFTLTDAAELNAEDEAQTQTRIARLVDHSLLRSPGVHDELPRYRLLEPLREFGAALLAEAGEADAMRQRHAGLFARRYIPRTDDLNGPRVEQFAAEVERDRFNLRAALETLIDAGADPTLGAQLCLALQRSWFLQGMVVEGVGWADRLLESCNLEPSLRIKILFMRAVMARHQYDYREAIRRYRELLAFYREAGEARRVALTLIHLAGCLCTVGDTDAAKEAARESLTAIEPAGDTYFIGHAHVALGLAENYAGRIDEAEVEHRAALACFAATESTADIAVCLSNLATCALDRDNLDAAETLAGESIEHAETARIRTVVGASLCVLGNVAIRRRDIASARVHLRAALSVAHELNDHERLAEVFEVGAHIAALESDAAFPMRFLGVAQGLRARCSAARSRPHQRAIEALEVQLLGRWEASRCEALRVAGGAMTLSDALDSLREFLTERNVVKLAR